MSEEKIVKTENTAENKKPKLEIKLKEEKRPKKKGRKKSRVSLRLALVMLVIALLFGIVVGYAVGRSTATARLNAAEKRIEELTGATEEAGREELDIFTDNLTPENRQALADLSGVSMQSPQNNAFLEAEEQGFTGISDAAESDPVVVAEFKGGQLMSDEVSVRYNERLTGYIFSGYTEEEVAEDLLNDVMQEMVAERVLQAQAEARGLTELSDSDRQRIDAEARMQFEELLGNYASFVYEEGMNEEQTYAAASAFLLEAEDISLESITAGIEKDWWERRLREEIVKAVQVSNEDILKTYNDALSEQRDRFTADAEAYEEAQLSGETILYNLSGYRAVKPLIISYAANGQEGAALMMQELMAKLDAGESFDSLLIQYGEDEAMQNPALRESGCYVSAATTRYPAALVSAAMALTAPGQLSGVIETEDGLCILEYVGEVPSGTVEMTRVVDSLADAALVHAQDTVYDAQKTVWLGQAEAKYYPERMH